MIYCLTRHELADLPIAAAVMQRGKELQLDATLEDVRRLFRGETLVVPLLDGERYAGAIDRTALAAPGEPDAAIASLPRVDVPVVRASTTTAEALAELDRHGGRRLIVVADDGATYLGIVCMRTDRVRLCVDVARLESHADAVAHLEAKEHP